MAREGLFPELCVCRCTRRRIALTQVQRDRGLVRTARLEHPANTPGIEQLLEMVVEAGQIRGFHDGALHHPEHGLARAAGDPGDRAGKQHHVGANLANDPHQSFANLLLTPSGQDGFRAPGRTGIGQVKVVGPSSERVGCGLAFVHAHHTKCIAPLRTDRAVSGFTARDKGHGRANPPTLPVECQGRAIFVSGKRCHAQQPERCGQVQIRLAPVRGADSLSTRGNRHRAENAGPECQRRQEHETNCCHGSSHSKVRKAWSVLASVYSDSE